ncbi:MAG: hypothetical protein JW774_11675 [Candidatus Aureabacteria bacterium]|nr:hypothetical protein [Candidatus Auribacterota bacterium]
MNVYQNPCLNFIRSVLLNSLVFLVFCEMPVQAEVVSSLDFAVNFLDKYESPGSQEGIMDCYTSLSSDTRRILSYDAFSKVVRSRFSGTRLVKKTEIQPLEKFDLKQGGSIIYLITKFRYNPLLFKYTRFEVIRIYLVREQDEWRVCLSLDSPRHFKGFKSIAFGKAEVFDQKKDRIMETVRLDAEECRFELDLANSQSDEELLAEQCILEGEKLYDKEEYRKAMMQFQKALSLSPQNSKAEVYIQRCKKAITMKLGAK